MSAFVLPPALAPGDLVSVIAPSGPVRADDLWRGLAWVRGRYRVRATPRILSRSGYLAGDDQARAIELSRAIGDPETRAIVAVRGGYGVTRLLDRVSVAALAAQPKWIVGFSDVTALHAEAWAGGIASIHGPHVGTLHRASARDRAAWLAALERPGAPRRWEGLTVVHPGRSSGPLVGGNLTLLESMAASGRLALPAGAILALEDVGERPYRIDRMLTALLLGRHLRDVSGIVLGEFDRCEPGDDGVTSEEVLAERTARLGIPVVAGAPFGHGARNEAFVLGQVAVIRGSTVELGGA
jgi:muramoyltetrapeptide carboxypeptidase